MVKPTPRDWSVSTAIILTVAARGFIQQSELDALLASSRASAEFARRAYSYLRKFGQLRVG